MEQEKLLNDISNLPPEARKQVVSFIASLKTRCGRARKEKRTVRNSLANESFIGIWKDREDMADSGKWLRNMRRTQWRRNKLI